jgi:hypothetical protein
MKSLVYFLFICFPLLCFSQKKAKDAFIVKVDSLMRALDRADTLTSEELWYSGDIASGEDEGFDLNDTIAGLLVRILSSPAISKYNPDSLLNHEFLGISHSNDKKLWIFTWYENTGGSFKSCLSVVHYKTLTGKPQALFVPYYDGVFSLGGSIDRIYKLPHSTRAFYLCMQSIMGCNTCCMEGISVIELTKRKIDFSYPAFASDLETNSSPGVSIYSIDSRCGSILKFEYNPKSATITYEYDTDDNTPVHPESAKTVKGKLKWNGQRFVEKVSMQ